MRTKKSRDDLAPLLDSTEAKRLQLAGQLLFEARRFANHRDLISASQWREIYAALASPVPNATFERFIARGWIVAVGREEPQGRGRPGRLFERRSLIPPLFAAHMRAAGMSDREVVAALKETPLDLTLEREEFLDRVWEFVRRHAVIGGHEMRNFSGDIPFVGGSVLGVLHRHQVIQLAEASAAAARRELAELLALERVDARIVLLLQHPYVTVNEETLFTPLDAFRKLLYETPLNVGHDAVVREEELEDALFQVLDRWFYSDTYPCSFREFDIEVPRDVAARLRREWPNLFALPFVRDHGEVGPP